MLDPTGPSDFGWGAAILWLVSSLSFAIMIALVGKSGSRVGWMMTVLVVIFATTFTSSALLVEARRNLQRADVRYAQKLLDGSWATLLDTTDLASGSCEFPIRLKVNDDRYISELTPQGFVYLYNAHIIKDEAVHALNPNNQTRVAYRPGDISGTLIKQISVPQEEPVSLVLNKCSK